MDDMSDACLLSLDVCINFTIISTLVVLFWRGTWDLMDTYLLPGDTGHSLWLSCIVGGTVLILLTVLQNTLNDAFTPSGKCPVTFFVTSRLHAYVTSAMFVGLWRGGWGLMDLYLPTGSVSSLLSAGVGILILAAAGYLSQASGPPLAVSHDLDEDGYFTVVSIQWKRETRPSCIHYFLGAILNILLVNTCIVAFWRGTWNILDMYIFPEDLAASGFWSVYISIGLAVPVFIGETTVRTVCRRLQDRDQRILQICFEKVYIGVFSLIAVIHWRGVWYLLIAFLVPGYPVISALVSHVVGFLGLMALSVSRTAGGGCSINDTDVFDAGYSVLGPHYLHSNCKSGA